MPSPSAALVLVRWPNALLAGAGVLVGAWWVGGAPTAPRVLLATASALGLAAFANADNDGCDVEIDRVAHPERPLPAGRLSPSQARATAAVGALVAIACSAAAGVPLAVATTVLLMVMVAYNRILKRRGIIGNATVAVVASLPFIYGSWAAGQVLAGAPLVLIAIPLHLAREIAKDLDDAPGDAPFRRTLPLDAGVAVARRAIVVAVASFAVGLAALAVPRPPFALLALPALVFSLLAARRALAGHRGGPLLFKSAMVCAMTALVAAQRG